MALLQEKQLGQVRPSDTSPISIYNPDAGVTAVIMSVLVCNTSGSSKKARIFLDNNGTTYDESTAQYWDINIPSKETVILTTYMAMNNSSGNIAVRSNKASTLTFTVYGVELTDE